jgi:putative ABC transport system permease protein
MLDRIRFELTAAARSLAATPALTGATILTLVVAVGLNIAMSGLIGRALLSPPAHVAEPDGVFTVAFHPREGNLSEARMTTAPYTVFTALRDRVTAIKGAAAFQRSSATAVVDGVQIQAEAMLVSGSYFPLLGAGASLGRPILPADDDQGAAAPVAVVSHAFWRSALAGDPRAAGRRIFVDGLEYTVAGVMPAGFSGHSATDVDVWLPFAAAMRNEPGWDRNPYRNIASILVRLGAAETVAAVETQAGSALDRRTSLTPIQGADVGSTERRIAWWLAGVSLLVFAIGLANAATLLGVRGARLRHDAAIRTALGASRAQLVARGVTEAVVLAGVVTALSLLAAGWLDDAIRRILFPRVVAIAGMAGSSVATAALAGLIAAIVATGANLWHLPRQTSTVTLGTLTGSGRVRRRASTALLLVQTSLSVLLLCGAGLFGLSFYRLAAQDLGMEMKGVVLVNFELGPGGVPNQDQIYRQALPAVRALPGVERATIMNSLPFGAHHVPPISVPGRDKPPSVDGQLPFLNAATPEFLQILGVRIVDGRTFTSDEGKGAPVVIVNETMARQVWPGERAVGKCIRIGFDPDFDPETSAGPPTPTKVPCREVIGVARDTRQRSLVPTGNEARLMQYFVPFEQVPLPPFLGAGGGPHILGLMLRASVSADALAPAIRQIVAGSRTDLPFVHVAPYAQLLDRQLRPWELGTTLLVLFSSIALGVAGIGLFASFAHAVAERRREMAIRLAIGARPSGVLALVLKEALVLAGIGAIAGCVASAWLGRWVQSLLFGTAATDPLVLVPAVAAMLVVAAAATFLPALSASRTDPSKLLRVD